MRQLVFVEPGRLEWQDVPDPEPGPGQAVIHPLAAQTPLPLLEMYTRGITVHTSRADSRRYLPDVLAMVAAGRIDPLAVPTTVIGWDDAAEHWLDPGLKIVVTR